MHFPNQTPEQYENKYIRRLREKRYQQQNLTELVIAATGFDAVWAIALGSY
jgi:SMC interacting uncharacterized protein involved in chromosome segregation